nr:alpha/beta fold hydrolase [Rhodococcus sp. DK17]
MNGRGVSHLRSRRMWWRSIRVDGRAARYAGGGSGPPVLFLHGWGLGGQAYARPLQELIDAGFRVYAPALPGFGGIASLPAEHRTLVGYARWIGRFADAIDLPGDGGRALLRRWCRDCSRV